MLLFRIINTLNYNVTFKFTSTQGMRAHHGFVAADFGHSETVFLKQGEYVYIDYYHTVLLLMIMMMIMIMM